MKERDKQRKKAFDDAVEWLVPQFREFASNGAFHLPEIDPLEFFLSRRLVSETQSPSGATFLLLSEGNAVDLVELAGKHAAAFNLAIRVASGYVSAGLPLPVALRSFYVGVAEDTIKRPRPPRRPEYWLRDVYLHVYVHEAEKRFGLQLSRRDRPSVPLFASKQEAELYRDEFGRWSACDAVAKALEKCGVHLGYSAVKETCVGKKAKQIRAEFVKVVSAKSRLGLLHEVGWPA